MRKQHKSAAVLIFVGLLLILIFAVGMLTERNPGTFRSRYMYDAALESFLSFCVAWWIPAGIIGIPLFLISLVLSLIREHRESRAQK